MGFLEGEGRDEQISPLFSPIDCIFDTCFLSAYSWILNCPLILFVAKKGEVFQAAKKREKRRTNKKRREKEGENKTLNTVILLWMWLCLSNFCQEHERSTDVAGKVEPARWKCSSYRGDVATVFSHYAVLYLLLTCYVTSYKYSCKTSSRVHEHDTNVMLSYLVFLLSLRRTSIFFINPCYYVVKSCK